MKLWYLAYRNMISRPLNLLLSLLLLALSAFLVTFVLQLHQQMELQLNKNIAPFDMVVGAKGSPLQLVLSSVLHIDSPTGNVKLGEVEAVRQHPFVQAAVPVSYGDNFKGFRILGTEAEYLDHYQAQLASGKLFTKSFDVVAGHQAARELTLQLGDTFVSAHGLSATGGEAHEEHPFTVIGILEPTGTVVDQLLITPLESIWESHDHSDQEVAEGTEGLNQPERNEPEEAHAADDDPGAHENHGSHTGHELEEDKEITSLLVTFRNPLGMIQMPRFINENTTMQAALPGFEIQRLMGFLGTGFKTINGIALAILLVSGVSIFISLLKTIRERSQEMALLRTYGLRTGQLLSLAMLEGLFLALSGFVVGWLLGRLGIWVASLYMQASYGYSLQFNGPQYVEFLLLGVILVLAVLAALLASRPIFKLNVAKTLSDG